MEIFNKLLSYFANDGLVALLTFVLSVVAFSLSVLSYFSSRSANKKLIEIEKGRDERQAESEQKATLSILRIREPRSTGKGYNSFLAIENSGATEAKNIEIFIDGSQEHSFICNNPSLSVLGPNTIKKVPLLVTMGAPGPKEVSLSWLNSDGTAGSYNTAY